LSNFATIESWFKETKIVIFENDSVDKTHEILRKWSNGTTKLLLSELNLVQKIPIREYRLAYIRNILLKNIPSTYEYFMMVDIDDVFVTPVKKESFESCFRLENWDIMTANSYRGYYDIYALRIPNVIEYNCWKRVEELQYKSNYTVERAIDHCVRYFQKFMSNIQTPLYVDSAFNVAILGKTKSLQPCCKYSSTTTATYSRSKIFFKIFRKTLNFYDCEHIAFNRCIRSHGGKILFNPDFKL
jgi:hypothetical protein